LACGYMVSSSLFLSLFMVLIRALVTGQVFWKQPLLCDMGDGTGTSFLQFANAQCWTAGRGSDNFSKNSWQGVL
jgi:hypothetical protein